MQNATYLSLSRHQIYYFRYPLPHCFHRAGKASHIKMSLDTRCPKEALRLARLLEYHGHLITQLQGIGSMDHGDIINLLKEYFYELIAQKKAEIHKHGPLPKREVNALIDQVEMAQEAIEQERDEIVPGESLHSSLSNIIQRFDLDMPEGSDDYRILQSRYKYAYKGYCEKILSHNQKQLDFPFTTLPEYLNMMKTGVFANPKQRLKLVISQYIDETKHTWGNRSEAGIRACLDMLMEMLGEDFNIAQVNIGTARQVKETLLQLPANRNKLKATRGLPITEQIKVKDVQRLSIASVNKYLTCYSGLCGWAKKNGYMNDNPFSGMMLKEEHGKKRDAFTSEQAQQIIAELDRRLAADKVEEYLYWGVMIALHTGARRNEIASLTPADVKQSEGIWYFDINDEEEMKRLKTNAAIRKVPVHSALLERGFLEYVERVKKMPGQDLRLLYKLIHNEKEGWGRKLGDWFNNQFLKKMEMKRPRLSFHSMRHTVITSLRRAKVDNHIVRDLVGHEPDGVTEATYHHGYELPVLHESIEKLAYA